MRTIRDQINIKSSIKEVFDSLIKPNAIKSWWSANQVVVTPKEKGHFIVQWGQNIDEPDYVNIFEFVSVNPPHSISLNFLDYYSKTGNLSFEANFGLAFHLEEKEGEICQLTVINSGFPEDKAADDFFQGCIDGWKATLAAIKDYNE